MYKVLLFLLLLASSSAMADKVLFKELKHFDYQVSMRDYELHKLTVITNLNWNMDRQWDTGPAGFEVPGGLTTFLVNNEHYVFFECARAPCFVRLNRLEGWNAEGDNVIAAYRHPRR